MQLHITAAWVRILERTRLNLSRDRQGENPYTVAWLPTSPRQRAFNRRLPATLRQPGHTRAKGGIGHPQSLERLF